MRWFHFLAALALSTASLNAQVSYNWSAYPAQGSPDYVALADFNRDGYPDMALVNEQGTVNVFFNDHTGHFGGYASYPIGGVGHILAIDANGDGWPDIVIGGLYASNTPLLNNGDGTFRAGTAPVTKLTAQGLVAGDFNKDGKVDIAVVENKQIEILLNNGSGTFRSGQILAMAGTTFNAVVADFDGDGKLDIANAEARKTLIWWGKGDGTFAAPLQIAAPTNGNLWSIATADFNNDGLPDFAVSSNYFNNCPPVEGACGTTTAHFYKNLGGRSFSHISSYQMGDRSNGVLSTADVNGDLNPDIVDVTTAGGVDSGVFTYRAGTGGFAFSAEQNIGGGSAYEIVLRDLNLDSRADVAIPTYFPEGEGDVGLATSGYKNCSGTTSGTPHAKICAPLNNATLTSPVLITAAGNSPIGVQRLEVWIDGKKVYQKFGDQMNKRFILTTGQHRISVVAVDKYVGTSSTVEYVNVQ